MRERDHVYGGKDFENKWVLRSVRNWSRESANVLQASLEEAGWRMNGGKEFHKAGAEWKKERFATAALTTVGRLRLTSMDERVLYVFD